MTDLNKGSVDWRKSFKVSSVKNQGDCGSCWAFSSVGAVESAWAIKHNNLYNLSEQELIDCSSENHGCEGGSMVKSFQYIIDNGLCSNLSYPYVAIDKQCNNTCKSLVKISKPLWFLFNFPIGKIFSLQDPLISSNTESFLPKSSNLQE